MTNFDYLIVGLFVVSVAISIWRGLVREVVSLLSWLFALWLAARFAAVFADWMPAAITNPSLRYAVAFTAVFLVTVIVLELLGVLLAKLLRAVGLGFVDRALGAVFGLARGALVAWMLILLGGLTSLPQQTWWRDSVFAPPLQAAALAARPMLPMEVARRLKYS